MNEVAVKNVHSIEEIQNSFDNGNVIGHENVKPSNEGWGIASIVSCIPGSALIPITLTSIFSGFNATDLTICGFSLAILAAGGLASLSVKYDLDSSLVDEDLRGNLEFEKVGGSGYLKSLVLRGRLASHIEIATLPNGDIYVRSYRVKNMVQVLEAAIISKSKAESIGDAWGRALESAKRLTSYA